MKTLFVTYYSDTAPSTFYKECAISLESEIKNLDGRIHVECLNSMGSYEKNCLRKPQFILDCLEKFNEPIIWIDADSKVNSLPIEMDSITEDVGCVVKSCKTPESALIFFNNTTNSKEFLKRWIFNVGINTPELDHPVLKEMWLVEENFKEKRRSLHNSICSVFPSSKVQIILSKTEGKSKTTKDVMIRRSNAGKIQ